MNLSFSTAPPHPEDSQDDPADFLLLGVGQDVREDRNDSEPSNEENDANLGFSTLYQVLKRLTRIPVDRKKIYTI